MTSYPKKYLTKDIIDKPTPLEVWIQGTIEQTVGNDILIVSDTFGRVKVVKCESAGGLVDKKSLRKGTYEVTTALEMGETLVSNSRQ